MKQLLFLLIVLPALCFGQIPEPMPNTYVNDFSGTLKENEVAMLNKIIFEMEKRTSVQIAIVLVNKLPENMEIDQYTLEIGRKWHVGNAHNGLVYVAAIEQRKQRLEVADNLQGDIPDMIAYKITNDIKPFFRNKDYYGGISELLNGISKRVDPVKKEQLWLAAIEQEKINKKNGEIMIAVLLWLFGGAIIFLFVRVVVLRNYFNKKRQEREAKEEADRKIRSSAFSDIAWPSVVALAAGTAGYMARKRSDKKDEPYTPTPYTPPSDDYTSKRNRSSSDDSSSYGNWGSGSSDDSSSFSGFSGGGASNDW